MPARASGPSPAAHATARFLPAVHADPLDAQMPARSRRVRTISASRVAKRTFVVLGRRCASAPLIDASAKRCSNAASSSTRSDSMRAASPASRSATTRAAAPKPAMPGTFSVPPRRPRSWWPLINAGSLIPLRTASAPTPFGPWSLCADSDRRSIPDRRKVDRHPSGRLCRVAVERHARSAGDARQYPRPARSRRFRCLPTSPRPAQYPVALHWRPGSASIRPASSTGIQLVAMPLPSSCFARTTSDGCSTADSTRWRFSGCMARAPSTARWFDSVAPLVNTSSAGLAPTICATSARARATMLFAAWPDRMS